MVNRAIKKIAKVEFKIGVSSGFTQAIREPVALILLITIVSNFIFLTRQSNLFWFLLPVL